MEWVKKLFEGGLFSLGLIIADLVFLGKSAKDLPREIYHSHLRN